MKSESIRMLVALPILLGIGTVSGTALAQTPADAPPPAQQEEGAPAPEVATPSPAAEAPEAKEGISAPAETHSEAPPPPAEGTAEAKPEDAGEAAAPEKVPEPVTGAFGVPLGERFTPCLVAKVLGEEPVTYRAPDKTERKGIRYLVEPKVPNLHFNAYSVDTTDDGVIFAVRGDYRAEAPERKCDVTKGIAASLEEKYGKPRGRSPFGHWYAFRDMSVKHYRGIRLYANRCRRGIYQIVYGDDGAKGAPPPATPEPTETSGL